MSRFAPTHVAALLLLSASLGGSLAACAQKGDGVGGSHSASGVREVTFDPNNVLDDSSMTDTSMTASDVQAFLDQTPYDGKPSALATYTPSKTKTKTMTAAQIIVDAASSFHINPMLLLVRAQLENELISKRTATPTELARAFGCGCATSSTTAGSGSAGVCTPIPQARGFENQARCAASQLRTSLDRLSGKVKAGSTTKATTDGTDKGWAAKKRQTTRDGVEVTPANDATAALYAYKPYVGQLGRGSVAGMNAHFQLWNDFTSPTAADPTTSSTRDDTTGNNNNNPRRSSATTECTRTCSSGSVCDESTGSCVSGCQVLRGRDSCPNGSECDRSDGLIGRCSRADCGSQCESGMFCDPTSNSQRCVECTVNDTTNCQAEDQGSACNSNGRCGCLTSADCGYNRGRTCDRLHGICMDNPNSQYNDPNNPNNPNNPNDPNNPDPFQPNVDGGKSTGTDPATDPSTTPADPAADPSTTTPADPAATSTPDLPSSSSSSSSPDGGRKADEKIDVPGSDSKGCSTAPSGVGASNGGLATGALGLALAAALRRRRRKTDSFGDTR